MKTKIYRAIALYTVLCCLFFNAEAFWGINLPNYVPVCLSPSDDLHLIIKKACKGIDQKINHASTELKQTYKQMRDNPEIKAFFYQIKTTSIELQATKEYASMLFVKDILELLRLLQEYNQQVMQPQLLKKIDTLFPLLTQPKKHDQLLSLLRQERIHLLELSDEFFTTQSMCGQMRKLEFSFYAELRELEQTLLHSESCTALVTAQKEYLTHPLVQRYQQKCNQLWNLYLDREIKLLKLREYRVYLRQKPTCECSKEFTYHGNKELLRLLEWENNLHLKQLDNGQWLAIALSEVGDGNEKEALFETPL